MVEILQEHRIELLVGVACPWCDYFNEEVLDLDDTDLDAHHLFSCDDCGQRIDVCIEATIQRYDASRSTSGEEGR